MLPWHRSLRPRQYSARKSRVPLTGHPTSIVVNSTEFCVWATSPSSSKTLRKYCGVRMCDVCIHGYFLHCVAGNIWENSYCQRPSTCRICEHCTWCTREASRFIRVENGSNIEESPYTLFRALKQSFHLGLRTGLSDSNEGARNASFLFQVIVILKW